MFILTPFVIHHPSWVGGDAENYRQHIYLDSLQNSLVNALKKGFDSLGYIVEISNRKYNKQQQASIEKHVKMFKKGKTLDTSFTKEIGETNLIFSMLNYRDRISTGSGGMSAGGGGAGSESKEMDIEVNLFWFYNGKLLYYKNQFELNALRRKQTFSRTQQEWDFFVSKLLKNFPAIQSTPAISSVQDK